MKDEKSKAHNTAPAEEIVAFEPMKGLMVSVTDKGMQVTLQSLTGSLLPQAERGKPCRINN